MNRHRKAPLSACVLAGFMWFWVLMILIGAVGGVRASGFSGEYLTDVWTADDGLPDSSVTSVAQTPDGYLWVGTYNGLARFDGRRFVTFDSENTPALARSRVRQLYVDSEGTLWINADGSATSLRNGTFALEWKGEDAPAPGSRLISSVAKQTVLLQYDGFFRRKSLSAQSGSGWEKLVPTNRFAGGQCVEDGNGTIWLQNPDKHLSRLVGTNFALLPSNSGLGESRVNCMASDANGRLWVGTDKGIAMWNGTHFQDATPTNSDSSLDVEFLAVPGDGCLWAVVNGSVRKAVGRRWILEVESLKNTFAGNLSRMGVQDDHHGGAWLYRYGRDGEGLWHVAANGQVCTFDSQEGLSGKSVNCYFEDREGNMWVALAAGGLVRIREKRFQTIDASDEISPKPAQSVCEEGDGTIWIGTLGEGLERWQAGTLTNLAVPGGMGSGYPFCVCPDAAGRLWVSAGAENLYVREHDTFKEVLPVIHGVKSILAGKDGRLWVGTKSGLFFANKESPYDFKLNKGSGQNIFRALAEDERGNVWAGAEDGTLFCIGTNNTTTAFHAADSKTSQPIWSLLAEEDGTIWAGTYRGGLLCFRDGKFTRLDINVGLPDNDICQIVTDDADNLWIGSHQGVFRVAKPALNDFLRGAIKSVPVTEFGRADGLPSLKCSGGYQPAAWNAHDGRLWFTTLKGAVSIQPADIQMNLLAPPVVIEEIILDEKDSLDATMDTRGKTLPDGMIYDREQKFLEIPPGKHQIEFRYTGLSLVASSRVRFRYRLDGAETGWVEAGTRRSAQYNLLPSGTYRFHVIACNNDQVWNETGDALTLKILPYFYETLWFRILASLVAGGLVAGAVWYSVTRRLRRKLEQLAQQQAVERERARIAKDIHDDLGANLTLIARLGHLARQEKTVDRIEKMESTARQAVKSLDEIVWAVNPRNDTLAHLVDYSGQFATDYLYSVGVRCLLDVSEQTPPREVPSNVRHNIFLVIKESLQNIVKHSRATEVWLRINPTNSDLRIVIEDNGCGFEPASDNAQGDGLRNMRQRMNELGGRCLIQRRAGGGTEIIIEMPWPHK